MITAKATTTTERISDVDTEPLPTDSGWAIVRLMDGLEVAHFRYLQDVVDHGYVLFGAAAKTISTERSD